MYIYIYIYISTYMYLYSSRLGFRPSPKLTWKPTRCSAEISVLFQEGLYGLLSGLGFRTHVSLGSGVLNVWDGDSASMRMVMMTIMIMTM